MLAEHLETAIGVLSVGLWLADYAEHTLEPLEAGIAPRAISTSVEAPGLGRAYRDQDVVVDRAAGSDDACVELFIPVTLRSERIGVLELAVERRPDDRMLSRLRAVATAIAYSLLAARRYTDVFELARRRRQLELPAEMQWELLPVRAHTGPDFALAGSVEPAYDIGGDNFDYAVDAGGITISLTDAMGHGTQAALLSTLAVSAQRNARRHGVSLRQQVRAINIAVHDHFLGAAFTTGLFCQIDRRTGEAAIVNAGHSLMWRVRGGAVERIHVEPDVPAGLFEDAEFTVHSLTFQPGDRLLLISDGVLEAIGDDGEQFGTARLEALLAENDADAPNELVRHLTAAVTGHVTGTLADDATALCLDFRRPTG